MAIEDSSQQQVKVTIGDDVVYSQWIWLTQPQRIAIASKIAQAIEEVVNQPDEEDL